MCVAPCGAAKVLAITSVPMFTDAALSELAVAGRLMGDLTAVQALLRSLEPGETRRSLAKKALKGLGRKHILSCDPSLFLRLQHCAQA